MITIYGMRDSGNCYKPRLLCALTGTPFRHVEVNVAAGDTRSAAHLARNPNGKVPLLEREDGRFLAESNAILVHLGEDSTFVPSDAYARAKMFEWLFFEQYSHEPFIAVRRALSIYPHRAAQATPDRMEATLTGGNAALALMEKRLEETSFLVGEAPSLADIALFAYTHMADEGGFDLDAFPAITAWLTRIVALPGFQPIGWLPEA